MNKKDMKLAIVYPSYVFQPIVDTANLLEKSFKDCGIDTEIKACPHSAVLNKIVTGDNYTHVISINTHDYLEQEKDFKLDKPKCVLMAYNLEQTPIEKQSSQWASMRLSEVAMYGNYFDFIITEAETKAKDIRNLGLRCLHMDIPFHPSIDSGIVHKKEDKVYDVFFLGCHSERRDAVIEGLHKAGISTYSLSGRDAFDLDKKKEGMLKSKICANIHFSDMEYFEKPRILLDYFANKAFVVSEKIKYPEVFTNINDLFMAKYPNLLPMLIVAAKSYNEKGDSFIKIGENAYNTYKKNYWYEKVIADFLKNLEDFENI